MKKLTVFMIVSFLILGLSLSAKTDGKIIPKDMTGLAPRQLFNSSDAQQMIQPNLNRDPDYQVYAYNAYDPSATMPEGPVTFVLNDPAGLTSLAATTSGDFIAGACWLADEETWYGSQYGGGLYSIDITTGAMTYIAATTESLMGIDYDDASGIMYGSDGTSLYTVDWTTGATTLIGSHNVGYTMIGIAGDGEGNMYGVTVDFSLTADLYSIDLATGNATSIGSTGGQLLYAQDLAFDKDDGVLYAAAYFGDGTPPGLYSIDTNTAAMTGLGDFPGGMEVSGFAIPYTLAEDDAPAAVSDLVVTPDAGGALSCVLDWVNPDLTFNGDPLTELLETRVYRDGVLIYTNSSPGIGDPDSYTDAPTASGLYNYAVAAYNSVGEGPSVSFETWVGEDVPNVVENLLLEDDDGDGYLTWVNPTTGLNGGAFNETILGYHLERSDGIIIEVTGEVTEYTDTTIPSADYYSYNVVPYNSVGDGGSVTSNTEWIGDAFSGILIIDLDPTPTGSTLQTSIENFYAGSVALATSIDEYPITQDIDAVFLLVGIYSSNYQLQEADVTALTNYLDGGGNVYLEGGDTWAFDVPTSLHGYFNITPLMDGTSDLATVDGADFLAGMTWSYSGENNWIDQLAPIAPAVTIFSNTAIGYDCGIAYDSGTYKTVGISFEITGLGGTNTLDEAVEGIGNFFGIFGPQPDPGYIEGTVVIADGAGDVEDVVVEVGGETTNPASDGTYSLELQPGTYDVTATLAGYDTEVIVGVIVTEGNTTTGVDFTLVTDGDEIVIAATKLNGNYPNPFNPVTTISYSIKETGNVTLEVYNLRGQLVKRLVNEVKQTGDYTVNWNGTDNSNKSVSSGVYFYKMVSEGNIGRYTSTKKMILMK